jgi:hypothetical protein
MDQLRPLQLTKCLIVLPESTWREIIPSEIFLKGLQLGKSYKRARAKRMRNEKLEANK